MGNPTISTGPCSIAMLNYPQDEGFARRANPKGWPSNHQPVGTIHGIFIRVSCRVYTILGFHFGFIQVIKPTGPMEQFAIFLLGLQLGFIYRLHGKIHHISIRVSFRVYSRYQISLLHGAINHISTLLGFHLEFISVIKSPGHSEKWTICLLGFHFGFI